MQRPQTSADELESKLAGFVRSYINVSRGEDPAAAEEALQWVCAGLEHLLGSLLPAGKHVRRTEWFAPTDWLFAFSKGILREV